MHATYVTRTYWNDFLVIELLREVPTAKKITEDSFIYLYLPGTDVILFKQLSI